MTDTSISSTNTNNSTTVTNKYPFKAFAFEGCGTTAFGYVGALKVFEDHGAISGVKYFIGSSSGSFLATALACGATVSQMTTLLNQTDFSKFLDDSNGVVRDTFRFFTKYGWHKGEYIEKWYGQILADLAGNAEITFKELHDKTGNYLVITTSNMTTGEILYMNHETTPNLMVKKAIRRSTSLPFIFKPDVETGIDELIGTDVKNCYVDGGLLNNYPIDYFDQYLSSIGEMVGFRTMTSLELDKVTNPFIDPTDPTYPSNIKDFLFRAVMLMINKNFKIYISKQDMERTVMIDTGNQSPINFALSDTDKQYMIEQGRQAAENFFSKH